jgi:hypothetical protein
MGMSDEKTKGRNSYYWPFEGTIALFHVIAYACCLWLQYVYNTTSTELLV